MSKTTETLFIPLSLDQVNYLRTLVEHWDRTVGEPDEKAGFHRTLSDLLLSAVKQLEGVSQEAPFVRVLSSEDREKGESLLPCPFCGTGTTEVIENGRMWTGTKYSPAVSVSVRHWCPPTAGQPGRMIERIGRDRESACAAWNTRSGSTRVEPL